MTDIKNEDTGDKKSLNFIEQAVEKDLKEGKNGGKVQTRFPPYQVQRKDENQECGRRCSRNSCGV